MNDVNENRRLSGIMFTDIVGYSAVMGKNESAAMKLLEEHKNISRPIIEKYNGKILKPQGDGYMIDFSSVVDAVRCAMDLQKEFSNYNSDKTEDEKIRLRIGIHMGDLIIKDNDIFGHDVNVASRIEKLSDPGGICISQTVYDQIKNKVEIDTLEIGETELKNIEDKINIYKVLLEAQGKAGATDANQNSKESEQEKKSEDKSEDAESDIKETIKKKIKDSIGGKIPHINIDIDDGDEKVKIDSDGIKVEDKDGSKVDIDLDGIKVKDKDGSKVDIDLGGIKVKDKDGSKVEIDLSGIKIKNKDGKKKKKNREKAPKKKISNFGEAITKLIKGSAFIALITGILTDLYSYQYGIIAFFGLAISGSSLKTLLKHGFKRSIIKIIKGFAFIVLITGILTDLYPFWYGIIGLFAIGILASSLRSLLGEDYDYIDRDGNKKSWDPTAN